MKPYRPTLQTMRKVLELRQRLDRRCDRLMLGDEDDDAFWLAHELYKRACRLELRLMERIAAASGHKMLGPAILKIGTTNPPGGPPPGGEGEAQDVVH